MPDASSTKNNNFSNKSFQEIIISNYMYSVSVRFKYSFICQDALTRRLEVS